MTMDLTRVKKCASRLLSLELFGCPENIGRLFEDYSIQRVHLQQ